MAELPSIRNLTDSVSLFERKVVVLGDKGINAKVDTETWDRVVSYIVEGMKNKTPVDGMLQAIQYCGDLLQYD